MIKKVNRKSMLIRESGRSSDFITPSFGYGCLFKCSYCYMRRHVKSGVTIAQNTDDIIQAIIEHSDTLSYPKTPNQTHDTYYTYDFSCNEDYILHAKYHDWNKLFSVFKHNKQIMGTAATKYVNNDLLSFNPLQKVRIRFSLMPQELSDKLEPGTSKIIDRIKAINDFIEAGYDVHVNYSPIIVYENSKKAYAELFDLVDTHVHNLFKHKVKAECIFLTHNEDMHKFNLTEGIEGEELLWRNELQEAKTSQYGGRNIRYKHNIKRHYINAFRNAMKRHVPWQEIRYIF